MYKDILSPPEPTPRRRILVADDDHFIRQLNTEVLSRHGYDVATANDGKEAWEELQRQSYDLLVTDYNMPRLSGLDLIRQIHDAHLNLPAILVTGNLPQTELSENPELPIEAVLLKPYAPDELLVAVKNVLQAFYGEMSDLPPVDLPTRPSPDKSPI